MRYICLLALVSCNSKKEPVNRYSELKIRCQSDAACYISSAEKDFDSGAVQVFIPGLVQTKSFTDFFATCLFNKKVRVLNSGDVYDSLILVYDKTMEAKIRSKFGDSFWDECLEEADSLSKEARRK